MGVRSAEGAALIAHLQSGTTNVCRCWKLERGDGTAYGFTDHDEEVAFEGLAFRPDSGMTAKALVQTTGLAVDNSEALGVLSDAAITEADIAAGRYDGATVWAWLVNWQDPSERLLQFKGTIGEITQSGGQFEAELRGLTETLNQPQGLVYQRPCSAVLGDGRCRVDLDDATFGASATVAAAADGRVFRLSGLSAFEEGWFERGRLVVETGDAKGLEGFVKVDRTGPDGRKVELWQSLRAEIAPGDNVRVEAGCDKRAVTCREKFSNFVNFRGFPHIPGEDWLTIYPKSSDDNDGGSLYAGRTGEIG